jgi:hypothetical protein
VKKNCNSSARHIFLPPRNSPLLFVHLNLTTPVFDFWYFVEEEEEEYDRRNKA